jgi:hypothetical protein
LIASLAKKMRTRDVILFVGAGVSQNLGLPLWSDLLGEMGKELGFEPDEFRDLADPLVLAEFYKLEKKSLGAFRSLMDRRWHSDESRVDDSPIHQLIVDLKFPIVYTTNYDRWLEIAHARRGVPYRKIADVRDIPGALRDETQIIKFHGDFDHDESLVLTEAHFFDRMDFESPLDIKLRADSLGKTILFIGYALADMNIRLLMYRLQRMWERSVGSSERPDSYIFVPTPNRIQETVLEARGIQSIASTDDDPGRGLEAFLRALLDHVRS